MHEVHAPPLMGLLGHRQRLTYDGRAALWLAPPDLQAFLAIDTAGFLVIGPEALAPQQNMDVRMTKPPVTVRQCAYFPSQLCVGITGGDAEYY